MNGALTVVVAAVMCTAALIGWVVISERLDRARTPVPVYAPRHAPRPAVTLPVAGRFEPVPDWEDEDEPDAGWQAQAAPPAPLLVADTSPATVEKLATALQDWTPEPYDPATETTGQLPIAVCTWGKPADELADELAARYLT